MGGHGGLNILPQKSWNVYGQRNRQKVAEDETERDAKEAAHRTQQERAGRERRLRQLRAESVSQVLNRHCLWSRRGGMSLGAGVRSVAMPFRLFPDMRQSTARMMTALMCTKHDRSTTMKFIVCLVMCRIKVSSSRAAVSTSTSGRTSSRPAQTPRSRFGSIAPFAYTNCSGNGCDHHCHATTPSFQHDLSTALNPCWFEITPAFRMHLRRAHRVGNLHEAPTISVPRK
jgi:hypothetical protein